MKILAVEFSTDQRSVAVLEGSTLLGAARETATRNTHAITLISNALAEARLEREQIECLAIGLGPGSYTGIRSAIALAQGWQLAGGENAVRLLGLSSVECLAAEAQAHGWLGPVCLAIDAQRQEVYLAEYELEPAARQLTNPLRLAGIPELQALAAKGRMIVGPEVRRWVEAGRELSPTAATLGRLAAERSDYLPGEKLEPIYLRETTFVKAPPPRHVPTA